MLSLSYIASCGEILPDKHRRFRFHVLGILFSSKYRFFRPYYFSYSCKIGIPGLALSNVILRLKSRYANSHTAVIEYEYNASIIGNGGEA